MIWLAVLLCFSVPVSAQLIDPLNIEPDANGVDMIRANVARPVPTLSVPGAPNLRLQRLQMTIPVMTSTVPIDEFSTGSAQVNTGDGTSEGFQCLQELCWPNAWNGSTMTGGAGGYNYLQGRSGVRVVYGLLGNMTLGTSARFYSFYGTTITYPNGETLTFTYQQGQSGGTTYTRPTTIVSNLGYEMRFTYQSGTPGQAQWSTLARAAIYETGGTVTLAEHVYGSGGTITDLANREWSCCSDGMDLPNFVSSVTMRLPDMTTDSFVATQASGATAPRVGQVVSDGVTWTYTATESSGMGKCNGLSCDLTQVVLTGPNNYQRTVNNEVVANPTLATVTTSVVNGLNETTSYGYDGYRRLTGITYPRGNGVEVEYDDFGNIITRRDRPTTYPTDPDLIQLAEFNTPPLPPGSGILNDNRCVDVRCYLPYRTRDADGNWTDYIWAVHGGMEKMLEPAGANNLRRLTHRLYATSGGITRLSSERICGVASSAVIATVTCPNSTTTQITNYTYWASTNLPETVTRTNGAGTLTAVTTYTYDTDGNLLSEDGPLTGTDDTAYYRYDAVNRRTWEIAPVGDAGTERAATTTSYRDADDQPLTVQSGTVSSPTDTTLDVSQTLTHSYNTRRLRTQTDASEGGTTYSVSQFSYDARNQLDCSAVRMNPAEFATLPTSACTLDTQGTQGPDRITRNTYDVLGRITETVGGFGAMGTGNAGITLIEIGYTDNGQVAWREDGNGNRTSYTYDPYDRLDRATFPDASYEQLTYNSRSLVSTFRRRGAQVITYAYDNASRRTSASYSTSDPTVTYTYDGLGRETQIARTGVSTISYDYDGLGRRDESTQDGRTLSYTYDIAGRRTRLLYPDNFDIRYDWSPAAQLTAIREQGGPTLVDYDYDGLGRMTQLTRSNGRVTDYSYGPLSRLSELDHVNMVANSFTYNPASQIATRTVSNNDYVWALTVDLTQSYAPNTLNQYSDIAGSTVSYDNNGNLTGDPGSVTGSSGSSTFAYDAENRLTSATGTVSGTLTYDGLGRMLTSAGGGETATTYLYDGDELVAEYATSGGALLRRYVHGAGVDDPMVWYEGSGVTDRRFLHSDERGSIIAVTANSGTVLTINTYDTWGVPDPDNLNRFQYTGQVWLPQFSLYQYKARMYAPHIGRFMQTDPIGYEDGMNMYAYVGNDPVNGSDPTGTICIGQDSEYCERSERYNELDAVASEEYGTTYFGAVADMTSSLANIDLPGGRTMAGLSEEEAGALNDLSGEIALFNEVQFDRIASGEIAERGVELDSRLVNDEQAFIQDRLDSLQATNSELHSGVIGAMNEIANPSPGMDALLSTTESNIIRAAGRTRGLLRGPINFGNIRHRRIMGIQMTRIRR
ncbi:RHS repeat-associated core domain-containing protein [Parasphingopyxis sp. CP4]|uniref:RHS repeat domain-containing protein n=1 Tax=Parasphingopyxis sp. CP4 TaxID=2724527 RepID=UPI00159FA0DE|nr:RHS repeat-associated core domain-containing protein [Parasphingopyxis sp. CP4]QLC21230.1 RHS repeat-associated core domain-containing protein [Parasphingopyxis sp. CP4]